MGRHKRHTGEPRRRSTQIRKPISKLRITGRQAAHSPSDPKRVPTLAEVAQEEWLDGEGR